MHSKQLREAILQMAIEGRLVEQDPADEPASALLERLREERERLVKAKRIRKPKATAPIAPEEVPFALPKGWEWVRLGEMVDFASGQTVSSNDIAPDAWILDLEDIEKDSGRLLRRRTMSETKSKSNKRIFRKGDVLYGKLRPYLNKVIIATEDGYCTTEILAFDFGEINNRYAQAFLQSPYFVNYAMKDAYGVKMPRLGSQQGNNALFPLPPLAEQVRIAAKLDEAMPLIAQYEQAAERLSALNGGLKVQLWQAVLQHAIEGRLVEQDPDDEPASVLLERIRAERERLYREGKMRKKDYERDLEPVDAYNAPYVKLPQGWGWCRLGEVVLLISGRDLQPNQYNDKGDGMPYITGASNICDGKLVINRWTPCPVTVAQKNDLLLTCKGTVGKLAINTLGDIHIARQIMGMRSLGLDISYLKYYMEVLAKKLNESKQGIIPGIGRNGVISSYIPLPPLPEQERIVAALGRIESLLF